MTVIWEKAINMIKKVKTNTISCIFLKINHNFHKNQEIFDIYKYKKILRGKFMKNPKTILIAIIIAVIVIVVSVISIPSINDTLQHTATENNSIFSVYEIDQ